MTMQDLRLGSSLSKTGQIAEELTHATLLIFGEGYEQ